LLIANLAHRYVEGTDWEYSEFSLYDLGQAVAHMTFQAEVLGLSTRQFRAFDRDGVAAEFAVPGHWEVTTMMAIGHRPSRALRCRRREPRRRQRTRLRRASGEPPATSCGQWPDTDPPAM
jgi:nitroreductase